MAEPLLCIGGMLLALLTGGIAGYYFGRKDERLSQVYWKACKDRYFLEKLIYEGGI